MTEIATDPIIINRTAVQVFDFLSDLGNYKNLMPEDQVSDFVSTGDSATLQVKGLGAFEIKITNTIPHEHIRIVPNGKLPFKFDIEWLLTEDDTRCRVIGKINAELNMFIRMVAEPKLRGFVDGQAYKLKNYLEQEIH